MDFTGKNQYNKGKRKITGKKEIAYQNKDITSKFLAENFKGKTFQVYGLDLPEIQEVLPTNIPVIKANELRLDNLFGLSDGTVAIVDYESEYRETNKVKYLNYLTGAANRYIRKKQVCPMLRMIVIYTGDIRRENTSDEYNIGAVKVKVESAFLSELDSQEIYFRLQEKVKTNQMLTDEELMEFIILPLSYKKREEKEIQLEKIVDLAVCIRDRKQQLFTLSGILVFIDKIINSETANRIRRAIEMTQVAQIFEEEKRQAVLQVTQIFEEEKREAMKQVAKRYEKETREAVKEAEKRYKEETREAVKEAEKRYKEEKREAVKEAEETAIDKNSRQIIMKMLQKNYSTEEISQLVEGYSKEEIELLRTELISDTQE